MIPVFLRDPAYRGPIQTALRGLPRAFETDRARFSEFVEAVQVAVLAISCLDEKADQQWFEHLAMAQPGKSWILVTKFEAENVGKLIDWGRISEIVWEQQIPQLLKAAVEKSLSSDSVARFSGFLRDSSMTPEEIVGFLGRACMSWPLPTTVKGLCRKLDVPEDRVRYLWRRSFQPGHSPKEFLGSLILARSQGLHNSLRSWEKVAEAFHLEEKTLRRICRRITGLGLSDALVKHRAKDLNVLREWWRRSRVS